MVCHWLACTKSVYCPLTIAKIDEQCVVERCQCVSLSPLITAEWHEFRCHAHKFHKKRWNLRILAVNRLSIDYFRVKTDSGSKITDREREGCTLSEGGSVADTMGGLGRPKFSTQMSECL